MSPLCAPSVSTGNARPVSAWRSSAKVWATGAKADDATIRAPSPSEKVPLAGSHCKSAGIVSGREAGESAIGSQDAIAAPSLLRAHADSIATKASATTSRRLVMLATVLAVLLPILLTVLLPRVLTLRLLALALVRALPVTLRVLQPPLLAIDALFVMLDTILVALDLALMTLDALLVARRLELAPHDRLARAIAIVLRAQQPLALDLARIFPARVLPLIHRQRRAMEARVTIPVIPAATSLLPGATPVLAPARRRIHHPAAEIRRRPAVIAHRHAQHERGHVFRTGQLPGTVVPGAGVPVVVAEHPIGAVVEEIVRLAARVVIDRIARDRHQLGEDGDVDADADADLRARRQPSAEENGKYEDESAHRDLHGRSGGSRQDRCCSLRPLRTRFSARVRAAASRSPTAKPGCR